MRKLLVFLAACHAATPAVVPSPPQPLPARDTIAIDTTPKERRRMLPPEVYLRAYLTWFGGLAPLDVQQRAKPKNLFDDWPCIPARNAQDADASAARRRGDGRDRVAKSH